MSKYDHEHSLTRKSLQFHFSKGLCDEMTSFKPVIAVFESQPYWGPELQRQFEHANVVIRECRSVADLHPATDPFSSALFVIDLESGPSECLEWLATGVIQRPFPIPIIACGSPATLELEWVMREMGVTAFLPEKIDGDDFARLCRRQLGLAQTRA